LEAIIEQRYHIFAKGKQDFVGCMKAMGRRMKVRSLAPFDAFAILSSSAVKPRLCRAGI